MRMDLVKARYETYDELYEYCYKVAGTVGLMTTPVMGVDPTYKVSSRGQALLAMHHLVHSLLSSVHGPRIDTCRLIFILNFACCTTALLSVLFGRQTCTARAHLPSRRNSF